MQNIQIEGSRGKLSARLHQPELNEGESCPCVILMHGFNSSKNDPLLLTIAKKLENEGIAYLLFDFYGHGDSEGDFQMMTVPGEIDDAMKVYDFVRSLPFVNHISLLGHSLGGVVAGMLAGQLGAEKIARLVMIAPAAILRDESLAGNMFGVTYDPIHIPEYITVMGRKLGRDYIKTAQTLPIYETALAYTGPVCDIHGKADDVVPYFYSERFKQGYKNCELHLTEKGNHFFSVCRYMVADIAVEFLKKKNTLAPLLL